MPDEMRTELLSLGRGRQNPAEIGGGGLPYLGSGAAAARTAEAVAKRPFVPPEHRIPPDQLPESLRARFPEGMPTISGGSGEMGVDLEKLAEIFGAQRDRFRKDYLALQRAELTDAEQKALLAGAPAETVNEVVYSKEAGELLPLSPVGRKVQMEVALSMAAFGAGLNYEDQNMLKIAQMNPEGSSKHDSPVLKLFQLIASGVGAEANLEPEQFAQQLAGADKKEAFVGSQARFYVWVKAASGKEYKGYVPLSKIMDKIDDPRLIEKIIVQNWEDNRAIPRPGQEKKPEGWPTGKPYSKGYVAEIGDLINEVLRDQIDLPVDEKIISTSIWHPLMSTRITAGRFKKEDVRDEVIDNLYSHFLAGFTLLRLFGRDRAWDKTLGGRVVDAFRKGVSPERYYAQLYGLPPEARGPMFLLVMYRDLWSEKLDKAFCWERIEFNQLGDNRSLEVAKREVQAAGGVWYSGWDSYESLAEIQRRVFETKLRREGMAASETWRESLMVLGLAVSDVDEAVATYEKSLREKVDVARRREMVGRFKQYVIQLNEVNPYGYQVYEKTARGASADGYRKWIAEKGTEAIYDRNVAMARPGEMRSFSEMATSYWTSAEIEVMKDVDFEGIFYHWGFSAADLLNYKTKHGADCFKGANGAKIILKMMSFDNMDYQQWKDTDPRKWHDYLAAAVNTSSSMIPASEAVVARETIKDILKSSVAQGAVFSRIVTEGTLDAYFLAQLKEAVQGMRKTFNFYDRAFKAHVGKEFALVLARVSCKLNNNQWHTVMRRNVLGDGAGWREFDLSSSFLDDDDIKLLKNLGLQFQGKDKIYQRNGYPITWQAQAKQMGLISPESVKRREFITPLQAMYGSRVLGYTVFKEFIRDVLGDFVFTDAEDVEKALRDLDSIVDTGKSFEHTKMTEEENKTLRAAEGPGVMDDLASLIRGGK